ncbi:Nramp family divalent metal transporter [Botrimarina sp.]|uniref:Nramp family divalent metal transporter n=1 Tax=Botrimarina sp. TaxID=2795802 RepID=UPI0032EBCD64
MSKSPDPGGPAAAAIAPPPKGLALAAVLGPSIVWCAEYIGSGEVILATRTGAVLGVGVLWAVVLGVALKYFIGLAGGWYTAATGEGQIDLLSRLPGPKNAVVWLVLVAQLAASVVSIGSVSSAAGVFFSAITPLRADVAGWMVALVAVAMAWVGEFKPLKIVMACLITVTLVGVVAIAAQVAPPLAELLAGLVPTVPEVPAWALAKEDVSGSAWAEMLPLLGWGAGGFASQVWYTYWIMGAGYGATAGGRQGRPADVERLRRLSDEEVDRLRGWRRVVTFDATVALVVGASVTSCFLIAGAGVLRPLELAPEGPGVATTLAEVFGGQWGSTGATLFLVGGAAALLSTQIAQITGWPMLLDDCVRICLPRIAAGKSPLRRRRFWLGFYLLTSMTIVHQFGEKPVALVKTAAIADGLLLTPVQALAVLVGLYWVMPRLFTPEVARRLRPGPWIGVGLVASFVVFTYFCVVQAPKLLFE